MCVLLLNIPTQDVHETGGLFQAAVMELMETIISLTDETPILTFKSFLLNIMYSCWNTPYLFYVCVAGPLRTPLVIVDDAQMLRRGYKTDTHITQVPWL